MTGARIIAALLVFMSHVVIPFTPAGQKAPTPFKDPDLAQNLNWFFNPGGSLGVSFFFILSGFVITWSARPGDRVTAYWRRRVVKIMPNHVVTWALAMLLFAGAYSLNYGLPNLFLFSSFSTSPPVWAGGNMPAWSLSSEMMFYLLFPLLIIPIRKIAESRLWLWAGLAVAGIAAVCLADMAFLPDTPAFPGQAVSITQFWFAYIFPPARLFEFVLGMIVARIVIANRWPRIGFTPIVVLLLAGYAGAVYAPMPYRFVLITSIPFALAIGTLASANLRGARTVLGTKVMVWLGNVSFGFYMTQFLVIYWLRPLVLGNSEYGIAGGILVTLGMIGVNVIAGWLLYTLVERPAMRWWSRSRKPVARPVTPQQQAPVPSGSPE
ncbi:acyltransferase [Planotetraspora sp. A-T 1434]|uniref:acyltransferase family protein n=1 Tax=Planotetraspora sp. A-T 1434 TaxID=2979219 RepID=UPI0021BFCB73|nr:acyltransferase [Planotetraspora sp. A-T 1434]MCT9933185.1 acyltransferase [Planotetraspora sp. A-T 1434]